MPSIAQVIGHAEPVSHPFSKVTDMVRIWHPRLGREVEIPAWQLAPCWMPRNTRLLARCGLPGVTTDEITMLVEVECSFDGQARLRDIRDGYGGVLVRPIIDGKRQPTVMLAWHKLQPLGRSVFFFCTLPPDRALTDSYVMAPTDVEDWARPQVYASSPSLLDCAYTCNTSSPLRAWLSSDGYRVSSHRPKNGLQGFQMQPSVLQRSSRAGYAPAVPGGQTRSQCSGVVDGAAGMSLLVPMCSAVQDGSEPVIGGDAGNGAQASSLSMGRKGTELRVDGGGRIGDARQTSAPTTTVRAAADTRVLARPQSAACVSATVQAGATAAQAEAMEVVAEHGVERMESAGGESSGIQSAAATGDGLLIAVSASTSVSGSDAAELQSLSHVAIGEGIGLAGLPVPQVADGSSRGGWEDRTPVGGGACESERATGSGHCVPASALSERDASGVHRPSGYTGAACERGSNAQNPEAISNVGVSAPLLVKGVDGSAQSSGTSSPTTLCEPALGAPRQNMPQAEGMSTAAQAGVTAAQAGASGAVAKRRSQGKDTAFAEVALQSAVPQGKDTKCAVVAHQSGNLSPALISLSLPADTSASTVTADTGSAHGILSAGALALLPATRTIDAGTGLQPRSHATVEGDGTLGIVVPARLEFDVGSSARGSATLTACRHGSTSPSSARAGVCNSGAPGQGVDGSVLQQLSELLINSSAGSARRSTPPAEGHGSTFTCSERHTGSMDPPGGHGRRTMQQIAEPPVHCSSAHSPMQFSDAVGGHGSNALSMAPRTAADGMDSRQLRAKHSLRSLREAASNLWDFSSGLEAAATSLPQQPWSRGAALAGQHPAIRQQLADMRAGTPFMRPGRFPTDLPDFRAYGTGCLVGGTMVATLEPRNEASGDVFELGVAESTVIEDYNGLELVVWTARDCHDDGRITLTRGGGSTAQGRLRPDRQLEAVEVDMSFHQGLLAPFSPQLGELTLMYSGSSDGEKPKPRIVQVIAYGESASPPLLHADDHVSVWNPLGHNGRGSEYGVSAWHLAPLRLPARTRVIALVPANGPDGGGPLMAVVAMLATWCDAPLHLPESRTGAVRIQVRPIFNGQPSAQVVSVKWTHVRLIDMAVTTYCSLPPMETSRPTYAVNPRDLRSWAQPLVYFCTDDSMHSYPQAVRLLRSCSSKLAFSKRSSNASKLACGDGGSADLCSDGTDLVSGSPASCHGVRVTTVRDSSSTSSAVTHARAQGSNGVLTAFDGTSVSTDPRTASCSPSSSSCHSTTRLSGDGSTFVPHDSAGTSTGDGDSTVLNGGDGVVEQCNTSCNNIREASVLSSNGSACVRHESAGTGDGNPTVLNCVRHESAGTDDGDPTVLNGGDGIAEQCSASCNNSCEAAVFSSDGSTSVPRSLEGSDVDLAPAPCDVRPVAGVPHSVCREDICAALAASADICSVLTDPTGHSGADKVARPDANSSRPDEEDSPAVLSSSSETHAAPTALSRYMVNPTCLSNNGDAGIQHAAAGSGHDTATDDHSSGTALTAATESSVAGAPPRTSVAEAPSACSSGARHPSRQCTHCGMLGHLVDRCWKLHPQLRRDSSPIQAPSTPIASGEQSSAAQTSTKCRDGDNTHRYAGARLRATAGSKSSAGASNHTASKDERALRKQVARLKQDAAVLRERLAELESRRKESAARADAHAASCCSGQQSTAFCATLKAIVVLCKQLLADTADPTSKVVLLSSGLADGSSGVTAPACSSSSSNSTVCGGAKPSTINSEHCNTGARTAVGDGGHDICGSCTGGKSAIKASVATSAQRKADAPHPRTAAGAGVNMAQQTVAGHASSRKPAAAAGCMHADDMLPVAVTPPLTAEHTGAITHNVTATARHGTLRGTAVRQPHSQSRGRRTAQQAARSQRKHGVVSAPPATRSAPVSAALAPATAELGAQRDTGVCEHPSMGISARSDDAGVAVLRNTSDAAPNWTAQTRKPSRPAVRCDSGGTAVHADAGGGNGDGVRGLALPPAGDTGTGSSTQLTGDGGGRDAVSPSWSSTVPSAGSSITDSTNLPSVVVVVMIRRTAQRCFVIDMAVSFSSVPLFVLLDGGTHESGVISTAHGVALTSGVTGAGQCSSFYSAQSLVSQSETASNGTANATTLSLVGGHADNLQGSHAAQVVAGHDGTMQPMGMGSGPTQGVEQSRMGGCSTLLLEAASNAVQDLHTGALLEQQAISSHPPSRPGCCVGTLSSLLSSVGGGDIGSDDTAASAGTGNGDLLLQQRVRTALQYQRPQLSNKAAGTTYAIGYHSGHLLRQQQWLWQLVILVVIRRHVFQTVVVPQGRPSTPARQHNSVCGLAHYCRISHTRLLRQQRSALPHQQQASAMQQLRSTPVQRLSPAQHKHQQQLLLAAPQPQLCSVLTGGTCFHQALCPKVQRTGSPTPTHMGAGPRTEEAALVPANGIDDASVPFDPGICSNVYATVPAAMGVSSKPPATRISDSLSRDAGLNGEVQLPSLPLTIQRCTECRTVGLLSSISNTETGVASCHSREGSASFGGVGGICGILAPLTAALNSHDPTTAVSNMVIATASPGLVYSSEGGTAVSISTRNGQRSIAGSPSAVECNMEVVQLVAVMSAAGACRLAEAVRRKAMVLVQQGTARAGIRASTRCTALVPAQHSPMAGRTAMTTRSIDPGEDTARNNGSYTGHTSGEDEDHTVGSCVALCNSGGKTYSYAELRGDEVRTHDVIVPRGGENDVRPTAHIAVMRQKAHGDVVARGFEDKGPNATGEVGGSSGVQAVPRRAMMRAHIGVRIEGWSSSDSRRWGGCDAQQSGSHAQVAAHCELGGLLTLQRGSVQPEQAGLGGVPEEGVALSWRYTSGSASRPAAGGDSSTPEGRRDAAALTMQPWSRGAALAGQHPAIRQQLADMRAGTPFMRPGGFPTDLPDFRAYGTGCLVGGTMVATLEPRNEASGDVFELGVAESTVIEDYNGLELVVWTARDCHDDGRITLTRGGGSTAQRRLRPDRQLEAVEVDMSFHQGLLAPFSPQLGELTLMYSRSSDGEKPKPRIVQVIAYGESASPPLLHADDHVSVWNPLGHNGRGSEYGVSAWRLAPLRLPARTRVIALVPANGPDSGGPLMAVVAMLATWCDAQLHLPESRTGAVRIQVRPIFNGQPSAHVVSVKWTHVRLIDMAVTTYYSLPPMETSRPAYAVNPRDLRSWAQPLVYFCTDDSMHSYPQAVRLLRSCSSKLAFSKRSSNASKLACGDGGSADLCSDGTDLVSGSPASRHGVRVTTVRDSSSTSSAVTHARAQGSNGVLTAFDGTSVSTDPRTASCSPSSSSCHSTTRLSGDGSTFVPHDSAGTSTGDGDSTVLNGGDDVDEQCSTSCNNICKASVLSSNGSACVRHESAGTGDGDPTVLNCVRHESAGTDDGDPTVLNGGDGIAEQCSASCNNSCEAAVFSSDGSTSVPRSLEGSDVDLAPAPCDVRPVAGVPHSVCREDICAALAASVDICSVLTDPTGDSGADKVARPGVDCGCISGGVAEVSISMASPVATTASDANSSRPDEDSPAVLNSISETHTAPTARSMVNPTCLSNNGDAGTQ
ncbi:hypothetical protein JKP88DRAFT_249901 [Tribonema minus]|uniref:Uncharacterized protein n=1 Tax=Tribonema minus TaxID=303371 RepID=A0A835YIB3_9STRA|nr:hypothetical protein JKP88DRAFT_249901 [Tribonema minus]